MSNWKDRFHSLYEQFGRGLPYEFLEAWAERESNGINGRAGTTALGEVGWFQLSPDEAKSLGYSVYDIEDDEEVSFKAGVDLVRKYELRVPLNFSGSAHWGLVKMYHTLPILADTIIRTMTEGADDWDYIAQWSETNIPPRIQGHDTMHWIGLVSDVMGKSEASGTVIWTLGGLMLLAGLFFLVYK